MSSNTYASFSKIFIIASWINTILTLVTYLVVSSNEKSTLVICSLSLALFSAACACIFYIMYRRARNREDLEIIKQLDEELRNVDKK